jgi:hypothetical protein
LNKEERHIPAQSIFLFQSETKITWATFNSHFHLFPRITTMTKTLVASLPPMTAADCAAFEKEGGIWGQQRAIRREQLRITGALTVATIGAGALWARCIRKNTWLVIAGTAPAYAFFGAVLGHAVGISAHPSVASNAETTMMRRVWWAKQCAADFDMSSVREEVWTPKYPNVDLTKLAKPTTA